MAIKKGLMVSLAEVGKIKTGYKGKETTSKTGNKFRPPKRLDYFVVTTTERTEQGDLLPNKEVMQKLGDKPRELKIRLPFDSVDKNFFTQYQSYTAKKKFCSGDGEKAMRYDEKKDTFKEITCDPDTCEIYKNGKCKVTGILSCFLPESNDLGGVYKYRTHSFNAVSSILAALEYFYSNTGGILQGLPLKLVMVKKTTNEHGTIDYPTIVIDGAELTGLRRLALQEGQNRKALGIDMKAIEHKAEITGFFKETDSDKDIAEEYFPDEIIEEPPLKNVTEQPQSKKILDELDKKDDTTIPPSKKVKTEVEGKPLF